MKMQPQHPTHPGEILREWITGKRMSIADTALLLDVSTDELNSILSREARLSPAQAVRLEGIGWGNRLRQRTFVPARRKTGSGPRRGASPGRRRNDAGGQRQIPGGIRSGQFLNEAADGTSIGAAGVKGWRGRPRRTRRRRSTRFYSPAARWRGRSRPGRWRGSGSSFIHSTITNLYRAI